MTDIWICLNCFFVKNIKKTTKLSWLKMTPNAYKTVLLKCYSCVKIDCRLPTLKIINDEITKSCVEKYNLFRSILISMHMFNYFVSMLHILHTLQHKTTWGCQTNLHKTSTHALTTYLLIKFQKWQQLTAWHDFKRQTAIKNMMTSWRNHCYLRPKFKTDINKIFWIRLVWSLWMPGGGHAT